MGLTVLTLSRLLVGLPPAGDPIDSDPGAITLMVPASDQAPFAGALGMSPDPGADGLIQGKLPPEHLNIDRFHQPRFLPWRIP